MKIFLGGKEIVKKINKSFRWTTEVLFEAIGEVGSFLMIPLFLILLVVLIRWIVGLPPFPVQSEQVETGFEKKPFLVDVDGYGTINCTETTNKLELEKCDDILQSMVPDEYYGSEWDEPWVR